MISIAKRAPTSIAELFACGLSEGSVKSYWLIILYHIVKFIVENKIQRFFPDSIDAFKNDGNDISIAAADVPSPPSKAGGGATVGTAHFSGAEEAGVDFVACKTQEIDTPSAVCKEEDLAEVAVDQQP